MRFELFTEKSVSQCLRDLNERLQAKATKSRPELTGWIEKAGTFSIAVNAPVVGKFRRTTRLSARLEREKGLTVIRGYVSDGISPFWTRVLFIMAIVIVLIFVVVGQPMLALVTLIFSAVSYIPLHGDYVNSDVLLIEIERTLKASPKPPKKK